MKPETKININNNSLSPHLKCQDYTVTNEIFDLILDEKLEMLITSPKPKNEDLGKYYESENYISHTDSKTSIFDKIYQGVKTYTISKKVKLINGFVLSEKLILDIGCGTGDFLVSCQKKGWDISGIEPNRNAKKIAEKKLNTTLRFNISEVENQTFDVITMWHVLEHVPNLTEYITQLKSLLKPNGTLLIAVPNYKSFDAKHYGKFWAAYDVPRHLWHFSKKSIRLLFEKEKMKVVKTLPMKFDSFYVSLLSEKYKNKKSNPLKAFFIGLQSNLQAKKTKEYSSLIYIVKNT